MVSHEKYIMDSVFGLAFLDDSCGAVINREVSPAGDRHAGIF